MKHEINYLKSLKKIIIEKSKNYFNKGILYDDDLKILNDSIIKKDFDKENIFRVLVDEKKVK